MNEWLTDAPQVTAKEADQLVELWLRKRLATDERPRHDPGVFTLDEIARALGAPPEEVAHLLVSIRSYSQALNNPKTRPAIPVKRSWRMIAAIYGCFAIFALFFIFRIARPGFRTGRPYVSAAVPTGISNLPSGISFTYLGQYHPGTFGNYNEGKAIDWTRAESALLENINKLGGRDTRSFEPNIDPKDISGALAAGPSQGMEDYSPVPTYDPNRIRNSLIKWERLTLDIDGDEITTMLPVAKVLNEHLDKGIQQEIKSRISGMLKALRARVDTSGAIAPPSEGV